MGKPVRMSGLDATNIDKQALARIEEVSAKMADKLHNHVKQEVDLQLRFREFHSDGDKHRYEVSCKVTYPGNTASTSAEDWDAVAAVRQALEEMEHHLSHKYKDNPKQRVSTSDLH